MVIKIVWDAVTLKQLVNSSKVIADQVSIFFTPEGIKVRGLSEHKIQMISGDIPSSAFKEYQCDREVSFGIRMAEVKVILKRIKKTTQEIVMIVNEENSQLTFQFDKKEFRNRLVEVNESRNVPDIPLTGFVEVDYNDLVEMLDDALLSDKADANLDDTSLNITIDEPKITFSRHTNIVEFDATRSIEDKWSVSGFGRIKVGVSFISAPIDELKGTADKVKISIGQDVPMVMEIGYIKYLIASRTY